MLKPVTELKAGDRFHLGTNNPVTVQAVAKLPTGDIQIWFDGNPTYFEYGVGTFAKTAQVQIIQEE